MVRRNVLNSCDGDNVTQSSIDMQQQESSNCLNVCKIGNGLWPSITVNIQKCK